MVVREELMDKIVSLCKRRGFIFQSSEIYGGIAGFWDYGPLGVELKDRIQQFWWFSMVKSNPNIVGMDGSIVMHPTVWKASGHVDCFHDLMRDCLGCKKRFRADHVEGNGCPECGDRLTDPVQFNLMLRTYLGPKEDSESISYLRPETAQAIYLNYDNIRASQRLKIPFGIAQVGKSFRNEVTPRNFIFRSREFSQMEMQFFIRPDEDEKWFDYWVEKRQRWYIDLGIKQENLRLREHGKDELAHYAKRAIDIEYNFAFGWQEIEGIHNRTDFDLRVHTEFSGKDLSYVNEETKEKFLPYIIETSTGLDRNLLVVLSDAYGEDVMDNEERVFLRLNPKLAPIQAAVFPLVKKIADPAREIEAKLRRYFNTFYDDSGSIGRRYRRQDEIGTPFCITFDFESIEDKSVTVRDRDTGQQVRVPIPELRDHLDDRLTF